MAERKRLWKVAAGAAILGLAAIASVIALKIQKVIAEGRDTNKQLAELRAELRTMGAKVRAPALERLTVVERVGAPEQEAARLAPSSEPAAPAEEKLSAEEQDYRNQVLREERLKQLGSMFATEQVDAEWAGNASATLRDLYSGPEFADVDLSVDCKSTLCRVTIHYADQHLGERAARQVAARQAWDARGFLSVDYEAREAVTYIAREGFDIPKLDPDSIAY